MTSRVPTARLARVDSGQAWLGSIPRHWPTKRIKFLFSCIGGGTPSKEEAAYWAGTIPWASPKDFSGADLSDTEDHITEEAVRASATRVVAPGSLLMVVRSGVLRHTIPVAINRMATALNQDLKALTPRAPLSPEYLKYLIFGKNEQLLSHWSQLGCTVESLDTTRVLNTEVPVPPLEEQIAIVNFLDRETARVDALIERKRRLIKLLQEKRAAVISHAVTRGVDQGTTLRSSGVVWFRDIPAHWKVTPFKRLVTFLEGPGILAVDFRDEGVPLLRVSCVNTEIATLDGCNYLDPETVARRWSKFRVSEGDLLISASASMGTVAQVSSDVAGAVPYTGIIRLRPVSGSSERDFLKWFVVSTPFLAQIDVQKAGSTIQHYGPAHLNEMVMTEPPVQEQVRIAAHIEREVAKLDRLQRLVDRAAERLLELRSRLVAAAVTGQIDVREVA